MKQSDIQLYKFISFLTFGKTELLLQFAAFLSGNWE